MCCWHRFEKNRIFVFVSVVQIDQYGFVPDANRSQTVLVCIISRVSCTNMLEQYKLGLFSSQMPISRRKAIILLLLRRRAARRKAAAARRFGVHPINQQRGQLGEFHKLVPQLKEDPIKFREYFRMGIPQFEALLEVVHNR
jgi:hypothetical protein